VSIGALNDALVRAPALPACHAPADVSETVPDLLCSIPKALRTRVICMAWTVPFLQCCVCLHSHFMLEASLLRCFNPCMHHASCKVQSVIKVQLLLYDTVAMDKRSCHGCSDH
jgi:hypothetical protein